MLLGPILDVHRISAHFCRASITGQTPWPKYRPCVEVGGTVPTGPEGTRDRPLDLPHKAKGRNYTENNPGRGPFPGVRGSFISLRSAGFYPSTAPR